MSRDYDFGLIEVTKMVLNQSNARFFSGETNKSEIETINEMLSLEDSYIVDLALDISKNGLLANDLPILKPIDNGKYLVYEGNRRITAIKLMTEYKNSLDQFNLSKFSKKILREVDCNIKSVQVVVSSNIDYINSLLERTHTARNGISRVRWNALAVDNFKDSQGQITRRKVILELVVNSNYVEPEVLEVVKQRGWISIFGRFIENDKFLSSYFGLMFDDDTNVQLLWNEKLTVERLSKLIVDSMSRKASEIAQSNKLMIQYLNNEIRNLNILNPSDFNDPIIAFNYTTKKFLLTNIKNSLSISEQITTNDQDSSKDQSIKHLKKDETREFKNKIDDVKDDSNESYVKPTATNESKLSMVTQSRKTSHPTSNTVIPKGDDLRISDVRTNDLYTELMLLNAANYINIASISLRSLIEFSMNCYYEKVLRLEYANVTFKEKFIKIGNNLQGRSKILMLKKYSPYVYNEFQNYIKNKNHDAATIFNIMVHNQNFHPILNDLQSLYNNFKGFLKLLWEEIDSI